MNLVLKKRLSRLGCAVIAGLAIYACGGGGAAGPDVLATIYLLNEAKSPNKASVARYHLKTDGSLVKAGQDVNLSGATARDFAIDSASQSMFVGIGQSHTIDRLAIAPSGSLSYVGNSLLTTPEPAEVLEVCNGSLFVGCRGIALGTPDFIYSYAIPSQGQLTGNGTQTGASGEHSAFAASSSHFFSVGETDNAVTMWPLPASGTLSGGVSIGSVSNVIDLEVSPDGNHVIATSKGGGGANCEITVISVATGSVTNKVVLNGAGRADAATGFAGAQPGIRVYACDDSGGLYAYSLSATGQLSPIAGGPLNSGIGWSHVAIAPGGYLMAHDGGGSLYPFALGAGGQLPNAFPTPVGVSVFRKMLITANP